MKIYCKYAKVHTPLFIAGTNLGDSLDSERKPLHMVLDEDHLIVSFKGEAALVPKSNVAMVVPINQAAYYKESGDTKAKPQAPTTGKPIQAQVSDPVRDAVMGVPAAEQSKAAEETKNEA